MYTIREYRRDDPEDARKLAQMWNESDQEWPGGFTQGVPFTAERIQQWLGSASRLAIFVVEWGEQIVGYCDLYAQKGQREVAYIDLLNVSPAHQGKGLGRDLILTALKRTAGLGFKQLTLHTWPGNLQAVPLYKKTGFFWKPDTHVFMQNFMPTILNLPVACEFFRRHDWYKTFRRDLSVEPDNQQWKGIPAYIYEWEAEGEALRVVIDREAETLMAVDTRDMAVSCIVERGRLAGGLKNTVRWEIANRRPEPLTIGIFARGDEGIPLDVQESVVVQDSVTIEREFRLDPQARPSLEKLPAPRIRSSLLLGDMVMELGSGVRILPAVDIVFNGCGLRVGRQEEITVNLRSHLPFAVKGRVLVEQCPELHVENRQVPFEVEAESWSAIRLQITPTQAGTFYPRLQVLVEEAKDDSKAQEFGFEAPLRCRPKQIAVRAIPAGGVAGSVLPESHEAVLENEMLTVIVSLDGGGMRIHHRLLNRDVAWQEAGSLGPPFEGWQQLPRFYSAHLLESPEGKTLVIEMPSADEPRLVLEKWVTLTASPAVKVQWRVVNSSESPFAGKLRVSTGAQRSRWIAIPTKEGVLHEPVEGWGEFPLGGGDLPLGASEYAESWVAWEEEAQTLGVVWEQEAERETYFAEMRQDFVLPPVPSQDSFTLPSMYLLLGATDWKEVRRWWQMLTQPADSTKRDPAATPVTEVLFEPAPLLLLGDETEVTLIVRHRRLKPLKGTLSLQSPLVVFRRTQFRVEDIHLHRLFHEQVQMVTMLAGPDAFAVRALLETEATSREFCLPVIKVGDARCSFTVSEDEDGYSVDNGWMRFRVAPRFGGSVVALEREGVNHLLSAYPEARPFLWFNSWFGGIHIECGAIWERALADASFEGEVVEVTGERGYVWKGVRIATKPAHRDWRWLRLECEYLTLPGSNLLATRLRLANQTPARMRSRIEVATWCQPSGEMNRSVAIYERGGQIALRHRTEYAAEIHATRWAAVQHAETGTALLMVNPNPEGGMEIWDCGRHGAHLFADADILFAPNESRQMLFWILLTRDGERLAVYREALQSLPNLP